MRIRSLRRFGALLLQALWAWATLWAATPDALAAPDAASLGSAPPGPASWRLAVTAEFEPPGSISATATVLGLHAGILRAQKLWGATTPALARATVELRDDSASPARAVDNLLAFAQKPGLLGVFVGRYSPPAFDLLPVAHEQDLILISVSASADGLTTYPKPPNPLFRLALRDAVSTPAVLEEARRRGWRRLGALLPNTAGGRSAYQAVEQALTFDPDLKLVKARWYNFGDIDMLDLWRDLVQAGADAVYLVGSEQEARRLAEALAIDAAAARLPVLGHPLLASGDLSRLKSGRDVAALDVTLAAGAHPDATDPATLAMFHADLRAVGGPENPRALQGWAIAAQAYDMTLLLLRAAVEASSPTQDPTPARLRAALEAETPFTGVTGHYPRPFAPNRHDAMAADKVLMLRLRPDGGLAPLGAIGPRQGRDR